MPNPNLEPRFPAVLLITRTRTLTPTQPSQDRKLRKGLRLLALLYSEQAMRYLEQGKADAARPLLQRSLTMLESLHGSQGGEEVSAALQRLAWLGRRQGREGQV